MCAKSNVDVSRTLSLSLSQVHSLFFLVSISFENVFFFMQAVYKLIGN